MCIEELCELRRNLTETIKRLTQRLRSSVAWRVFERFSQADGNVFAPMIAYTALFSMFPIMLAALTLIGAAFHDPSIARQAEVAIAAVLPPQAADKILSVLRATSRSAGLLGSISLVGVLWAGSNLFGALEMAFDRIYRVSQRGFLRQRLMSVVMIFIFAIFLILALASSSVAQLVVVLSARLPLGESSLAALATAVSWLLSFAFSLSLFTIVYLVVPNLDLGLRHVWPGSLLGTVVFFLMLQVFPLYVRLGAGFNEYGALFGFFFVLLTWLYLLALILLLGACLNAVLHTSPPSRSA